ncbi:bifunctional 5,10-methylenetetrahydrofolate dehydrogenase/5,10-methenyltetrahydrofolate cyclohydrolase [Streptomyces arboris]|uniref:bifunctional 5,10-methylenetetrahydrofolate dehydrogenase/5,10-methenyltetrahydrofolate cyclohydrolase n=1 Tax=Streptomyces arboris TaxID=2600619 RepID=UPI003C2DC2E2
MDGTGPARRIIESAAATAADFHRRTGTAPCLATVLVGEDLASVTYVRMKQARCAKAGIESRHVALPASISTGGLVEKITELSEDPGVHGILLQHPVGPHIDERAAFEAIAPDKDVDGVTMHSEYDVELTGKHAVVVGRSPILGKPAGMLLLERNATVTYCHSRTSGLSAIVRQADVLVAAVGRPRFITGADIKPGAVVIDAGYNPGNVGDVDFASAAERAGLITSVPGGVGPMTIAVLLAQTVEAAVRGRDTA